MSDPREFPFLDSIVDEVLEGRRIVLVPPGTWAFVCTNVAFVMGAALWCAAVLPGLLAPFIEHKPVAQLIGLGVALPQLLVPAVLVARGALRGRALLSLVLSAWLVLTGVSTILAIVAGPHLHWLPCLIAFALLGVARLLPATRAYRIFSVYQQRVRERRSTCSRSKK